MLFKIESFKYQVLDGFGDPLKQFIHRESALDFIYNKPDCKVVKIDYYNKFKHMEAKF